MLSMFPKKNASQTNRLQTYRVTEISTAYIFVADNVTAVRIQGRVGGEGRQLQDSVRSTLLLGCFYLLYMLYSNLSCVYCC